MKSIQLDLPSDASPTLRAIADVFTRQINQRCDVPVRTSGPADFTLELRITPGIGAEGFRIEDVAPTRVRIAGNDERGVLERFVGEAGSERILFGTDLPWFNHHYYIGSVLGAAISDEDRHNILHRNAEKLLQRFV